MSRSKRRKAVVAVKPPLQWRNDNPYAQITDRIRVRKSLVGLMLFLAISAFAFEVPRIFGNFSTSASQTFGYPIKDCDYLIQPDYTASPVNYLAINCLTGVTDFQKTDFVTVWWDVTHNLPTVSNIGTLCPNGDYCSNRVIQVKGYISLTNTTNFLGLLGCATRSGYICNSGPTPNHITIDLTGANITNTYAGVGPQNGMFTVTDSSYIIIRGGILNIGGKIQHGIITCRTDNVIFQNLDISNTAGASYGIYLAGNTTNETIINNYTHHTGQSGIAADDGCSPGATNNFGNYFINVINNRINNWDYSGSSCSGINCNGLHTECAVACPGDNNGNWIYSGNIVGPSANTENGGHCVDVGSMNSGIFSNNIVHDCKAFGIFVNNANKFLTTNNIVYSTGLANNGQLNCVVVTSGTLDVISYNYAFSCAAADFSGGTQLNNVAG